MGPKSRQAKTKPVKAEDRESFSVFCGSLIYVFEKVNPGNTNSPTRVRMMIAE